MSLQERQQPLTRRRFITGMSVSATSLFLAACAPRVETLPTVTPTSGVTPPTNEPAPATATNPATRAATATNTPLPRPNATEIPRATATFTPTPRPTDIPTATRAATATTTRPFDTPRPSPTFRPTRTPDNSPVLWTPPSLSAEEAQRFLRLINPENIPYQAQNVYTAEMHNRLKPQEAVRKAIPIFTAAFAEKGTTPVNFDKFESPGPSHRVREGGFSRYSFGGGRMHIQGENEIVYGGTFPFGPGLHYDLYIKGLTPDGYTSDRNRTTMWAGIAPGHISGEEFDLGPFVSEEQAIKHKDQGFTLEGNNGDSGASQIVTAFLDLNTGALEAALFIKHNPAPLYHWKNY